MTFTVTPLLTTIDLAESATPWSSASLDADFYKQGSNSAGFYMAKNARGSETVTPAASVAWSSYTFPHLYFWANSSVAAKMEAKSTGTTTASGVTVRVTLANGAYREWHVTGSDFWDGGWANAFVIDMSHTGTELYASSGTFTNASNIASVTWYFDLSNSGNIRNVPANCWLDAIRVGEGLQVHNTSAADASFGFAEIAADDQLTANQYGVCQSLRPGASGIGLAGKLVLGDAASTNHLDFDSQSEFVEFLELDGSGYGLVNDGLYGIEVVANATGTDQDFSVGVKVGTGADAGGRNGTTIKAGGSAVVWYFEAVDADLHNLTMYGVTMQGATGGTTYGIELDTPTTTFEVAGCTFDGCEAVVTADAVVTNTNFLNSATTATTGALVWQDAETDIENCLFVNNVNGIYIGTLTGNITLSGMTWSGNTYDIEYEHTADWDANYDGSAPSINNTSTGTLTAVSSKTATFTPIENGSAFTITKNSDNSVLKDVTSTTGGEVVYTYDGTLDGTATTIHLIIVGKEPIDFPWTIAEGTVPVSQVTDRIYSNP